MPRIGIATQHNTPRSLRRVENALNRCPRHLWLSVTLVGIAAFLTNAALSLFVHMPLPFVHDEFSYLLAGDTFAHGRLTNPTPVAAEHFETMHVLVRPTYMSKYPPGQGVVLASGQVIAGKPIVGVWVSTAMAAVAL